MRRALLPATLAVALVAAASAFGGGPAGAGAPAAPLRPNIVPLSTKDVQLRTVHGNRRMYLSFETENAGLGPLEMQPVADDCDGDGSSVDDRTAVQDVYGDTDGSGAYTPGTDEVIRTVIAGCFVYHAAHAHWHFENYARYQLYSLAGDRLRSHSKVGFCMLDTSNVEPGLPGNPGTRRYLGCPDLALQGISVGWSDIYSVSTAGQFVGVQGLATGMYCMVGTADPADRVIESDEADNQVRTRVRIGLHVATVRDGTC